MNKAKLIVSFLVLAISYGSRASFRGAIAVWHFTNQEDKTKTNSYLAMYGNVVFVKLGKEETIASKRRGGDGRAAYFRGGWFSAGQGVAEELNISGNAISILVRVKADSIKGHVPLINKAGTAQTVAYSIALNRVGDAVIVEALVGNDHITGAHYLKHTLPKEKIHYWHDIIVRLDGKKAELFVDGSLVDEEVAVSELRNWNRKPFLIGAQYKASAGYGTADEKEVAYRFEGLLDHVAIWDRSLKDKEVQQLSGVEVLKDGRPTYYSELYRPQFHFSAKKNGLNDPNGLVYYNGVYHLFFQCWGYLYRPPNNKDWGHAVSRDLIHWQQTDDHITPHKMWGGVWSGSAVVDIHNVTGFQAGEEKPVIAFMTTIGTGDTVVGTRFTQSIAYSVDGGKTFNYYDQNPIIRNITDGNRDPKVVWDELSKQWVMALFMKDNEYAIFSSADLKAWKHLETITLEGVAECPGFEQLPVDGNPANKKWIFFGANGNYIIGSFDGKHFTAETKTQRGEYGGNYYAAQTWSNVTDGRSLLIAWMASPPYPGMPFNQQMTFPNELTLRTTPEGIRAFRMPVREIEKLYDKKWHWKNQVVQPGTNLFTELKHKLYDIELEIDMLEATTIHLAWEGVTIAYDAAVQQLSIGGNIVASGIPDFLMPPNPNRAPLKPVAGKIKLRVLIDRTSIEIFGNDGEIVMTTCYMPEEDKPGLSLTADSAIEIINANVHSLRSAWPQ